MLRELKIQPVRRNQVLILNLDGVFTDLEVYKLSSEIDRQFKDGARFIILDLLKVSFIDSAGIGIINATRMKLEQAAGALIIVRSPKQTLAMVLNQCAIFKLVRCYEETQQALNEIPARLGGAAPDESVTKNNPAENGDDAYRRLEARVAQLESELAEIKQVISVLNR